MIGKMLAIAILITALVAGAALYYLQVYAYYDFLAPTGPEDVEITPMGSDMPEPLPHDDFQAIDAASSPIRYRACFTTAISPDALVGHYEPFENPTPLLAPRWFKCFNAGTIEKALATGHAHAFMGQENIHYGVDRVIAVTDDGRGYVWHQLNDCGETAYDGSPVRDDCPEPPKGN